MPEESCRQAIDTGTDQLLCRIEERVGVVTLNRPEVRNALSDTLTPALRAIIPELAVRPDVGCIMLTGTGTAFCAGGDVKTFGSWSKEEQTPEEKIQLLRRRQRTLTGMIYELEKPVIAALPGRRSRTFDRPGVRYPHCRGAGVCHHRVWEDRAAWRLRGKLVFDPTGWHGQGAGTLLYLRAHRRRGV